MSKDKYPNIYSGQMEVIVFIILKIFLTRPLNFGDLFLKLFKSKQLNNAIFETWGVLYYLGYILQLFRKRTLEFLAPTIAFIAF